MSRAIKVGAATNTQEVRHEGEDAYYRGKSDTSNPYDVQSDYHLSWNDGYADAQQDDDPEGGNL